jgi:hypothetical protein
MSQAVANLAMNAKAEAEKAIRVANDAQQAIAALAEQVRQLQEKVNGQNGPRNNNR